MDDNRWHLVLPEAEAMLVVTILAGLARHYREDVRDLPRAVRGYWTGTSSTEMTGESSTPASQEADPMLAEARLELRSERAELAEKWVNEYELAESHEPWQVELDEDERQEVVSMLNDRRMTLALEIGLTDREIEADPYKMADEARRMAVMEIDLLGHVILVMLGPQIHRP